MNNRTSPPSWFDLRKYEKQRDLDLRGWFIQIVLRRDLRLSLAGGIPATSETFIGKLTALIHEDPVPNLKQISSKLSDDYIRFSPGLCALFSDMPQNQMAVHATTLQEYVQHKFVLKLPIRKEVEAFYAQFVNRINASEDSEEYLAELDREVELRKVEQAGLIREDSETTIPYPPEMDWPLYASNQFFYNSHFFSVDLSLPDKLLVDHFKKSLQTARKFLSRVVDPPLQYDRDPTKGWHNEQLLAYLDLSFEMSLPGGLKLSRSDIANMLWPSGSFGNDQLWGEDHLKEVTEGIAQELLDLNSDRYKTLLAMAAADMVPSAPILIPADTLFAKHPPTKTRRNRGRERTASYVPPDL